MNKRLQELWAKAEKLLQSGRWDELIPVLTKIIALEENPNKKSKAYKNRGLVYDINDEYDRAIADYDKAIELTPDNAKAYKNRGFVYLMKEEYVRAIEDFVATDKRDPTRKFHNPEIYIALQINAIHGADEGNKGKSFRVNLELLDTIDAIQGELFYKPRNSDAKVAHYTSLHTLKNLAEKGHFRLYNAAYMNDPEEGEVFFEMMKEKGKEHPGMENIKDIFYEIDENRSHRSPAYIGSFVKIREGDKDKLFLWRTYGKHDNQEAAGSCLIFKRTCFARKHQIKIRSMQQIQTTYLPIYKICYKDTESERVLSKKLKILANDMNAIKEFIATIEDDEQNNKLKTCP